MCARTHSGSGVARRSGVHATFLPRWPGCCCLGGPGVPRVEVDCPVVGVSTGAAPPLPPLGRQPVAWELRSAALAHLPRQQPPHVHVGIPLSADSDSCACSLSCHPRRPRGGGRRAPASIYCCLRGRACGRPAGAVLQTIAAVLPAAESPARLAPQCITSSWVLPFPVDRASRARALQLAVYHERPQLGALAPRHPRATAPSARSVVAGPPIAA